MPGLRREETALLVGVSPQYYIRLERGDATGVSESVIDGIAHALRLDDAERAYLLDLLRTAGAPSRDKKQRRPTAKRVRPTIQRLVDAKTFSQLTRPGSFAGSGPGECARLSPAEELHLLTAVHARRDDVEQSVAVEVVDDEAAGCAE